jgi:uncharacterized protein (DUF305 family)
MTRTSLLVPVALGALLFAACGSDDSSTHSRSAAASPVDRTFVAQMIPHHRSAVQMAQIAQRRGASAFVRQLAADIVRTQTAEISTMRAADQRLRDVHAPKGLLGIPQHSTGMDVDLASLKSAEPFDRAFMRMMIPHHQGAVVMANAELVRGDDPELKTLARHIIGAQQREIARMRTRLGDQAAAGTPHSPGTPADDGSGTHGTGHMG